MDQGTLVGFHLFFNFQDYFQHNVYILLYIIPREPRRDPSNCRILWDMIHIQHCQGSNSQPVPSQARDVSLGTTVTILDHLVDFSLTEVAKEFKKKKQERY